MKKSGVFLTILTVVFCLSAGTGLSQTVIKTTDQVQKKDQNIKVRVNGIPKNLEKELTIVADSAFKGLGNDLKDKKITVTVTSTDDGNGNSSSYSYSIGDSIPKNGDAKTVKSVNANHMMIMQSADGENSDLTTAPYQVRGYRLSGHPRRDPFAFNPSDTSIVSYNKKDMGKGLEKITIVRKKATGH